MTGHTQFLPSIGPLAEQYDAFILDLWGVIHDGTQLYPGVKQCLQELQARNKKIIFLSNAPRRAHAVEEALSRMGITADLYDKVITSGETACKCLADKHSKFFTPSGKNYFYIGLEKDRAILSELDYCEVKEPEKAQFLLLSHPYYDNQPYDELLPLLERCKHQNIPALCINPDLEVVRLGGQQVYCAGALAEEYKKMGGEVVYFGKPHPAVYDACSVIFADIAKSKIVAVGDNLATDIIGAEKNGIGSVLIIGGILHKELGHLNQNDLNARCQQLFTQTHTTPNYMMPAFNW